MAFASLRFSADTSPANGGFLQSVRERHTAATMPLVGLFGTNITPGLKADVLAMRAEMARHKPAKGPLDAKLARGGLVDLEFITHYLQLRDGVAMVPQLGQAVAELEVLGLLPDGLAAEHDVLTRMLVATRLLAPDSAEPPPSARAVLRWCAGPRHWPS